MKRFPADGIRPEQPFFFFSIKNSIIADKFNELTVTDQRQIVPILLKKKRIAIVILFFSLFSGIGIQAQVLRDTFTFRMMCKGVDYIYNQQFDEAQDIFKKIIAKYPGHPMTYVYKGLLTYWENYPLIPTSPERSSFENDMRKAIEICESEPHPNDEAEYLLSNIGARGMLLLFYADNELSMEVISLASSTYQYVKQSFNHTNSYADFYFITGLYNYYREAYPQAHPVYKPLAFLFPKGNKLKGLQEMNIASQKAIVLKAEAYSFLSGIYISFENNFQQAYQYSKALYELYPNNVQYLAAYIKNLLLVKRYDEAERLIRTSRVKSSNAYFQAQLYILNGILYEKKYKNLEQARTYYVKGIRNIVPFGEFADEFTAYGYFGLSRIYDSLENKHKYKTYRKQAMDLADYKNVNFDE